MMELSILAPLKIDNENDFKSFIRCLKSYKNIIETENTEFLVVNESITDFKDKVNQEILSIKPNFRIVEERGFVKSVRKLIEESNGKYIMFFLDDVEIIGDAKNICQSSVKAMEENENIFQIKIGGGKVSNSSRSSNIKKFSKTHKEVKINENFSVWLNPTENEYHNNGYVITQWNCITRGKIFREFNRQFNGSPNNWDGFTLLISDLFKKEVNGTYTGWLNLQSFLYPWGRTPNKIEQFKELVNS